MVDVNDYQSDPRQVISDALKQTDFPVEADKINIEYDAERGLTQVFVESESIVNNKNARLALRQAIGQNLTIAYSQQREAFSEQKLSTGVTIGRGIEIGPPMREKDGAPSLLYQFRDPAEHVDLRPYLGLITSESVASLFRNHYISGPNPDGVPVFTPTPE